MADNKIVKLKELRKLSGAGILNCKKALDEAKGNVEEAVKYLRKKGMASAGKKADRETSEGVVASYIHYTGKLGVLVELLCETDFVARTAEFKAFAQEIAIHIAASEPQYVKREDIPTDILNNEKEVYAAQIKNKPKNIIDKIVDGKLEKYYKGCCLMEQIYYREDKKNIADFVKENIAKFGENIRISRFTTYEIK
jgi:elongation factor Ts